MRLLLITNDYPPKPGGIQQYLGNLVARFPGEVKVLAPADHESVPGVTRSENRFMWPTPAVRDWAIGHAEKFRPDFILFGAPYPLPTMGPALSRAVGAPYGVIAHGAEVTVPAAFPISRQLLAGPLRRADVVFSNSNYTTRRVEKLTGRPVEYLGIGVDLEAFHPGPPRTGENVVVGSVSRFVPRKQQLLVIEAADYVHRSGIPLRVSIVGKGRLEDRLRRAAESSSVPVDLHVDVPWAELPSLYRHMDIFAVPTRSRWMGLEIEGLGIVFLEAAATGLPVIAGTSGGSPETVLPGVTGYVVGNRHALIDALRTLASDGAKRARMGSAGRSYMEESYTWEAVIERLMAGLESAVKRAD